MPWYLNPLFGQAPAPGEPTSSLGLVNLLVAVVVVALSFFLGSYLAKRLRMPDHGWKIGVILFTLFASLAVLKLGPPLKLGVDLRGGVILVYEVDQSKRKGNDQPVDMDKLIDAIKRRVNPAGTKEVVIRKYGNEQVEIINPVDVSNPQASKAEVDHLKRIISSVGDLQFRILASTRVREDADVIERARAEASKKQIRDAAGNLLAWWVPIKAGQEQHIASPDVVLRQREIKGKTRVIEALVLNDEYNVTGAYLTKAGPETDEEGRPAVGFTFDTQGGQRFGDLTSNHRPDPLTGIKYRLGIVLDDELYSAPTIDQPIHERGIIKGSFSQEEVEFLVNVLNAGSLPAALTKEPISELYSGATLGSDMISKSLNAMLVASVLVPLFMLVYYRFSGIVAVIALALNMLILFSVMLAFRAAFTLTGFAGLALTVGMAVDNNILVFERLREEHDRGATLRMAIRNAFHRAGTTIIDCNLTHMIAATVLWFLGTDQLKGFAVTLWLGVVTSMYTSVFVSHVIFAIAEKRQWIRDVKMMRLIGHTSIDFMSWFPYCLTVSVLITIMAIGVSFVRGKGLFDIDFTGGVSVQAVFDSPQKIDMVRKRLGEGPEKERLPDLAVTDVRMEGQKPGLQFMVNTSEPDPKKVQDKLNEIFGKELARNSFTFSGPDAIRAAAPAKETPPKATESTPPALKAPAKTTAEPANKKQSRSDLPSHALLAFAGDTSLALALADEPAKPAPKSAEKAAKAGEKITSEKSPGEKAAAGEAAAAAKSPATGDKPSAADLPAMPSGKSLRLPAAPLEGPEPKASAEPPPAPPDPFLGGAQADLTFQMDVNYETVEQMLETAMKSTGIGSVATLHEFANPDYVEGERVPFKTWTLKILLPPKQAGALLTEMQQQVAAGPIFPASSQIGSAVATNTRLLAVYALVASWVCIIIYLWIRFQGVAFGLAAVVALVHDVFVMLGGIAISYYIADYTGFLGIDQFKINLIIVAAFLTIIGYSVNDTIVVFDRIREVRGKDPNVTRKMVNDSVNQTLSRTLLTSFTVFLVVAVLYAWGGEAVHGFAFALLIGVITGTYSSIYIAAPILLWLVGKRHHVAAFIDRKPD